MGFLKDMFGAAVEPPPPRYRDCTHDDSSVRWGSFPMEWGSAALHAHALDPNVTNEGKGRALAELDRRRARRSGGF